MDEPVKNDQIGDLIQQLAETEAELHALTAGQVDAVLDPSSGLPILLRGAQAELRRAHDELVKQIRERTAELTKTNRLLEALIETMPVGAVIADADGNLLSTNAAARSILGSSVHGSVTHPERDHTSFYRDGSPLPPQDFPLAHALEKRQIIRDVEIIIRRADSDERTLLTSAAPVLDEAGEVLSAIAIFQDITEREQLRKELRIHAEHLEEMVARRTAALRTSEARFRTIFEESVLGIALLDQEGQIEAINPALQHMLGYDDIDLSGTALSEHIHPEDARTDTDLYQSLVSGELDYYQVEKRMLRKDGQARWSEMTLSRVGRTFVDEPVLVVATIEDTTEKKRNQEALLRAEKLEIVGRLGASLAHEINNPIQSVIGCLGLAEEMLEDRDEVRGYLGIAMEELERAAGIVSRLRDMSRASDIKKEPVDLNALVEISLLLTRQQCQSRGVEVEWSPATGLPAIPLAADQVQQVFLNLILNAIEAMPGGGRLQISTAATSQPQGIRIRFDDTGQGIAPDMLADIFEPFRTTRPDGLGLGLHVSKQIVEEHGGRIDVDSRAGEGTTFAVWLPR
jgi:PAS domain S-box-containing protein